MESALPSVLHSVFQNLVLFILILSRWIDFIKFGMFLYIDETYVINVFGCCPISFFCGHIFSIELVPCRITHANSSFFLYHMKNLDSNTGYLSGTCIASALLLIREN